MGPLKALPETDGATRSTAARPTESMARPCAVDKVRGKSGFEDAAIATPICGSHADEASPGALDRFGELFRQPLTGNIDDISGRAGIRAECGSHTSADEQHKCLAHRQPVEQRCAREPGLPARTLVKRRERSSSGQRRSRFSCRLPARASSRRAMLSARRQDSPADHCS